MDGKIKKYGKYLKTYDVIFLELTTIQEQCVQIIATIIVANIPTTKPAPLNAAGIANIPVPKDAFKR